MAARKAQQQLSKEARLRLRKATERWSSLLFLRGAGGADLLLLGGDPLLALVVRELDLFVMIFDADKSAAHARTAESRGGGDEKKEASTNRGETRQRPGDTRKQVDKAARTSFSAALPPSPAWQLEGGRPRSLKHSSAGGFEPRSRVAGAGAGAAAATGQDGWRPPQLPCGGSLDAATSISLKNHQGVRRKDGAGGLWSSSSLSKKPGKAPPGGEEARTGALKRRQQQRRRGQRRR